MSRHLSRRALERLGAYVHTNLPPHLYYREPEYGLAIWVRHYREGTMKAVLISSERERRLLVSEATPWRLLKRYSVRTLVLEELDVQDRSIPAFAELLDLEFDEDVLERAAEAAELLSTVEVR